MSLSSKISHKAPLQLGIDLFDAIYLCRAIDDKTKILAKQNKGGTFHISSNGHELLGAACALCLQPKKDFGLAYYRDRGFVLGLGADPLDLLGAFLAKGGKNHSGGRMMPEHFCQKDLKLICQSSVVGSQFLQAVGIAKSISLSGKKEVVYVSCGDGATSQGDFHEALNFATIHNLPIIFVVQDNGWAISVEQKWQTSGASIAKMTQGYTNLQVHEIDGCNFEQIFASMNRAVEKGRTNQGPSLIIAKVPRLSPHSSSDDHLKYKSVELIEQEHLRDPLILHERYLIDRGVDQHTIDQRKEEIFQRVEELAKQAALLPNPSTKDLEDQVFAPHTIQDNFLEKKEGEKIVMVDAIQSALKEKMEQDPSIVVFGQDVAGEKGGVFKATHSLERLFGNRCFNTPLAESTIIGLATGMSMAYHRPVAEVQFADYLWTGINQLFNELSSMYFRSNGSYNCPTTIRMPCGGYIQGGPYHSQNIEGFLAHTPGLKIVYPSNAEDAKALLKSAIEDPNPVIFLEHKALYRQRSFSARIEPLADERIPLGKAKVVLEGDEATIISWGMMTAMAFEVIQRKKLSCDLIDLRTIVPLDMQTILTSVQKTGKVLILQEAQRTCGFGSEIAAILAHDAFEFLDGPIHRLCGKHVPVSYGKELEDASLPQSQEIEKAIINLCDY